MVLPEPYNSIYLPCRPRPQPPQPPQPAPQPQPPLEAQPARPDSRSPAAPRTRVAAISRLLLARMRDDARARLGALGSLSVRDGQRGAVHLAGEVGEPPAVLADVAGVAVA